MTNVNIFTIQLVSSQLSNAEKLTSRFWVLNRKSNASFQVSFLFKSLSKNREVIFCIILSFSYCSGDRTGNTHAALCTLCPWHGFHPYRGLLLLLFP